MGLYEWLLFLHLLSAFVLVAALVALWTLVFGSRPGHSLITGESATRLGNIAGPMTGLGMTGTIIFGIWLALTTSGYSISDGWIIGALVLWVAGGATGGLSGKAFSDGKRSLGVWLQLANTIAVIAILALMVWKPGS